MLRDALIRRLAAILVLGVAPYLVFVGETGRVVHNGVVVQERYINYAGVVLAAAGIALALTAIFRRSLSPRLDAEPTPMWGRAAALALGLFCAWQVAASVGY